MAKQGVYTLPKGAWDSHVHVVDSGRFPYHPDRPYTPKKADLDDLLQFEKTLGIDHVCIVCMSVYWEDNSSLLDALKRLNGRGRGVVCMNPKTITDDEIAEMHKLGARGVRINLRTTSSSMEKTEMAELLMSYANRLRHLQWAIQLYVRLSQVALIADVVPTLGIPVIIDHLGHPDHRPAVQQQEGYPELLDLLQRKLVYTKMSGTYRFSSLEGLDEYAREVLRIAPTQVVWASDWPHSGGVEKNPNGDRKIPQDYREVDDIGFVAQTVDWCGGDENLIRKVWVENPRRLWQYSD